MTAVILGMVLAGLAVIAKWDKPLILSGRARAFMGICALLEGAAVRGLTGGRSGAGALVLSVAGGCLLLACVTDVLTCQVYNFTWWPVLAAVAFFLWELPGKVLLSLAVFWALQLCLFQKMYGRADCYAFCVCAAAEAVMGMGMEGFLLHMLLAWTLLALVQAAGGNVGRRGRLRKPVPFLPYITLAFWVCVFMGEARTMVCFF